MRGVDATAQQMKEALWELRKKVCLWYCIKMTPHLQDRVCSGTGRVEDSAAVNEKVYKSKELLRNNWKGVMDQ